MAEASRSDLKALAQSRLVDARILLANRRHSSAYYVSGYAIELALKAAIAGRIRKDTIPDPRFIKQVYVHDLNTLLKLASLSVAFADDEKADRQLNANWAIVKDWTVESRYEQVDPVLAVAMVNAVGEEPSGVFTWLQKHW